MNTIVVIEDHATQRQHQREPYPFGSALDVLCLCGARIHPIVGAWCPNAARKCCESDKLTNDVEPWRWRWRTLSHH